MTNEKMERQLAAALEKTAPDDMSGVLSRCEERKGTVIPMTTKNPTKRKWTSLIAACLAVVLFGGGGLPLASAEAVYQLRSCAVLLAVAAIGATPLPRLAFNALGKTHGGRAVLAVLEPVGLVGLLAVCTAYLVDGSFNPFLYFRF